MALERLPDLHTPGSHQSSLNKSRDWLRWLTGQGNERTLVGYKSCHLCCVKKSTIFSRGGQDIHCISKLLHQRGICPPIPDEKILLVFIPIPILVIFDPPMKTQHQTSVGPFLSTLWALRAAGKNTFKVVLLTWYFGSMHKIDFWEHLLFLLLSFWPIVTELAIPLLMRKRRPRCTNSKVVQKDFDATPPLRFELLAEFF